MSNTGDIKNTIHTLNPQVIYKSQFWFFFSFVWLATTTEFASPLQHRKNLSSRYLHAVLETGTHTTKETRPEAQSLHTHNLQYNASHTALISQSYTSEETGTREFSNVYFHKMNQAELMWLMV